MNIFLEASRIALRIPTSQGSLSVEQLWSLSLTKLATIIRGAKAKLAEKNNQDDLQFLDEVVVVNKTDQLIFDILKEIYLTKKEEQDSIKKTAEMKAHNEKIMALIHQKQEASLGDLTIDQLKALLQA